MRIENIHDLIITYSAFDFLQQKLHLVGFHAQENVYYDIQINQVIHFFFVIHQNDLIHQNTSESPILLESIKKVNIFLNDGNKYSLHCEFTDADLFLDTMNAQITIEKSIFTPFFVEDIIKVLEHNDSFNITDATLLNHKIMQLAFYFSRKNCLALQLNQSHYIMENIHTLAVQFHHACMDFEYLKIHEFNILQGEESLTTLTQHIILSKPIVETPTVEIKTDAFVLSYELF